jgi:hypothetical protein
MSLLRRSNPLQDTPASRQACKRRLILLDSDQGLYIRDMAIAIEPRNNKTIHNDINFFLV